MIFCVCTYRIIFIYTYIIIYLIYLKWSKWWFHATTHEQSGVILRFSSCSYAAWWMSYPTYTKPHLWFGQLGEDNPSWAARGQWPFEIENRSSQHTAGDPTVGDSPIFAPKRRQSQQLLHSPEMFWEVLEIGDWKPSSIRHFEYFWIGTPLSCPRGAPSLRHTMKNPWNTRLKT